MANRKLTPKQQEGLDKLIKYRGQEVEFENFLPPPGGAMEIVSSAIMKRLINDGMVIQTFRGWHKCRSKYKWSGSINN
jgi:hypothetical protein